jgi:Zn-dependent protease
LAQHLLRRRFRLAKLAGIDLFVHWSFVLVVAYVAYLAYHGPGGGKAAIAIALLQLLGMFTCVTLHEYGHALAARRYGIPTADITLLPIGGLARLGRMPRIPIQEFIVALAGPMVNVVIAALLCLALAAYTGGQIVPWFLAEIGWNPTEPEGNVNAFESLVESLSNPSVESYLLMMIFVNIALILFNMIPAFPMDGGRVLRSILAMLMDYRRATYIASRLGLFLTALMALTALSADPPRWVPLGIAIFIAYAGTAEARQVNMVESLRGIRAKDAIVTIQRPLRIDDDLATIAEVWRNQSSPILPVVTNGNVVVGTLSMQQFAAAIEKSPPPFTTAGELVDHERDELVLRGDDRLEDSLDSSPNGPRWIPVVDDQQHLLGMLDLNTLLMRKFISHSVVPATKSNEESQTGDADRVNPTVWDAMG